MKAKDIVVGQDYAVGSKSYNRRATVLGVGRMDRKVWDGWRHNTVEGMAVRVRYPADKLNPEREEVVALIQVIRPWAEQEELDAQEREAQRRKDAQFEATRVEARLLSEAFKQVGPAVYVIGTARGYVDLSLTVAQSEWLRRWLAELPE